MQKRVRKGHLSILMALGLAFVIFGCQEDDSTIDQQLLEETAFAENVFAQLSSDVDDAMPYEGVSSGRHGFKGFGFGFGECMTRTTDETGEDEFPKTITIDYDGECTSDKGVVKSGTVVITLTGPPREEGSQRIVTFENFTVNGNAIEGTKTFTYNGAGQFTSTLVDGRILTRDGDVIVRESTKTRTLIAGGETDERSDDVYEVTGIVLGETTDGTSYKKEIIEPLIVSKECFWISQGIVETTIGDAVTTVDFGDGTCDDVATRIDADGTEEEFVMDMKVRKMRRHRHSGQNQNG